MTARQPLAHRSRQRATTIVEVLVAMAAGLLLLSAMASMFAASSAARAEIERSSQQMENGRFALDLLREDIHMAGYYGGYMPSALQSAEACVPRSGLAGSGPALGWTGAAAPFPIHGYASGDIPAGEACFTNLKANTDVLVLRSVDPDSIGLGTAAAASNATDQFLQISSCGDTAIDATIRPYVVALGGDGAQSRFTLHDADCMTPARVRKLIVHAWYIGRCSVCSGSPDTIPTLRMIELTGSTTTNSAMVEGIESMRVEYSIDRDGNGVPDTLSRCKTSTDSCSSTDWQNVVAVQLHLLARSSSPTPGHVDRKVYDMGLAGTLPAFTDNIRRHRYGAMVAAYNRIGPRAR